MNNWIWLLIAGVILVVVFSFLLVRLRKIHQFVQMIEYIGGPAVSLTGGYILFGLGDLMGIAAIVFALVKLL